VRLVLDEMWNPAIAVELVFERAQADGRTVVTDNVGDFEHQRQCWETRGSAHQGVIYAVGPH
jgi:hypothetical protein